jgi:glucose/arabinose dehydrogenase
MRLVMVCAALFSSQAIESGAATLPLGFKETRIPGAAMNNATAMAIAPDGRVFVSEQGAGTPSYAASARLRVIKNDVLLTTPALTLTVDGTNERGLLGIAFDPDFTTNQHVYLYYTVGVPPADPTLPNLGAHNRISRFTLSGDTVVAGSELVVLELPALGTAPIHNAGSMHFGPDGKLYISVGDNFNAPNSQNLSSPMGKLLRINVDGTFPSDNPFVGTTGAHGAIWAYGLRNPYTFAIQPGTGRILVNDVGDKLYDEINLIKKGANYGWGETEGPHDDPRFEQPFYYQAWSSANCTTIGAAFYDPPSPTFPSKYLGKYFFADLCGGWIKVLDPATGNVFETFVTSGLRSPVDLDVAPDGSLYYLNRGAGAGTGEVFKIEVSDGSPNISVPPASQTITIGDTATFTCTASGFDPLQFSWFRNNVLVQGPTQLASGSTSTHAFTVTGGDNGASIRCHVENPLGARDATAVLTATNNQTPNAAILSPAEGATYRGGDTLLLSADGSDGEDGVLPESAFTWEVLFDHDSHSHPGATATGRNASYLVPTLGEQSTNVKYRAILRVKDSTGLVRVLERNVLPQLTALTIASTPAGREVRLDGIPRTAPLTVVAVEGMTRTVDLDPFQHESEGGPTSQASDIWYEFVNWSDGLPRAHTITIPATDTTLTAGFNTVVKPECITFPTYSRFLNTAFPNQTGQFSLEFDATPVATTSAVVNANIGFSDGPRGGLPGQAAMIIFSNAGRIQARGFTGGEPAAASAPTYVVNQTYHFRLEFNLVTHTYDAYYTAPGQPEALLRAGMRYRVEHQFITQLNNWGVFASPIAADPSATVRVCRVSVNCGNGKNTPPVVTAPANVTVRTGAGAAACSRFVSDAELGQGTVSDNCKFGLSAVTRTGVPAGNVFPVGTTTITYSATDGAGLTTTATQTVTVLDDTAPTISGASATPNSLWPPNSQMKDVTIHYTTADNCGTVTPSLAVSSNEPVGPGGDWQIVDAHHVKLRAKRDGGGSGRIYTITILAVDAAGNATSQNVTVTVPHNQ